MQKIREICFSCLPPQQVGSALELLGRTNGVEVRPSPCGRCISVSYDLYHHTLEKLEDLLIDRGFHLDNSLLHKLRRALIHHCEACELENLHAPTREDRLRQIYLNVYRTPDSHGVAPTDAEQYYR